MRFNTVMFLSLPAVLTLVLFFSCEKSEVEEDTITTDTLSEAQLQQTSETDDATDGTLQIIEASFVENQTTRQNFVSLFPECAEITTSTSGETTIVTIDFGTGCTLNNGAEVSGQITYNHGPVQDQTVTITYQFTDFIYNSKQIFGGGSLLRMRSNADGNPQTTAQKNWEIIFPSEMSVSVTGTRISTWIEGVGSGTWTDNVYLHSGDRTLVFSNGFTHQTDITTPLRREITCPFFVSGVVAINRNELFDITLDYGDGTCDNLATLTVNGNSTVIRLRRN